MQCFYGPHETLLTTTTNGVKHCTAHDPKWPDADQPIVGRCSLGHGPVPVWMVPRFQAHYCAKHLRKLLYIASWPRPVVYPDDT